MSNAASKLLTRLSTIARDSWILGRALASQAVRRNRTDSLRDAFRNVIVSEARQSNGTASSLLSLQHQIGLIQYHGIWEYMRQQQGHGLLQSTSPSSSSSGSSASPAMANGNSTILGGTGNSTENVAKVAFMITASMRKELSERLGYTAETIKSMTPTEASLILHYGVKREDREAQLPSLLRAHEAQQERQRQEQARQEEEQQKEQLAMAAQQVESKLTPVPATSQVAEPTERPPNENRKDDNKHETPAGYNLEEPKPYSLETPVSVPSNESMPERISGQTWYEVIETRTDDDSSSSAVLLFSTLEEAEMAMELKKTFAERRANEDKDNLEDIPATTYSINKTIK